MRITVRMAPYLLASARTCLRAAHRCCDMHGCALLFNSSAAHPHKVSVCDNEQTQQPPRTFASKHVYEHVREQRPCTHSPQLVARKRACLQTCFLTNVCDQARSRAKVGQTVGRRLPVDVELRNAPVLAAAATAVMQHRCASVPRRTCRSTVMQGGSSSIRSVVVAEFKFGSS